MHEEVILRSRARIHIDLVDMTGNLARMNGSIGMSIAEPCLELRFQPSRAAADTVIAGPNSRVDEDLLAYFAEELAYARKTLQYDQKCVLEVRQTIPRHSGLGSGTQVQLGMLRGVAALSGKYLDHPSLIALSTRGRTSGIGCALFDHGGFVIDGGRQRQDEQEFLPSHFASPGRCPPVIFRSPIPRRWGVVLFVPRDYRGLEGVAEREFMLRNTPIPKHETGEVCQTVFMELLPGLVQEDLQLFAKSIDRMQRTGWKRRHWDRQDLAGLVQAKLAMERAGLFGVGLSSTGPSLFALYLTDDWSGRESVYSHVSEALSDWPGRLYVTNVPDEGHSISSNKENGLD